jgi:hypothetical protein
LLFLPALADFTDKSGGLEFLMRGTDKAALQNFVEKHATYHGAICVLTSTMSKRGQEEETEAAGEVGSNTTFGSWHEICIAIHAMKTGSALFWRKRAQVIISALLILGIAAAIMIPARTLRGAFVRNGTFFLAEPDLATPIFSSALMVQHLNATLHDFAEFAGYDQFRVRLEAGGAPEVVSSARFSGALFPLLKIEVLLEEKTSAEHLYIGEALWERRFSRDPKVIGRSIRINGQPYVIAGITRANR